MLEPSAAPLPLSACHHTLSLLQSFSTVQRDALLLLEHSPPLLHQFDLPPEINEILSGAGPLLRADHQEVWLGASTGSSGANLRAASGLIGLGEK